MPYSRIFTYMTAENITVGGNRAEGVRKIDACLQAGVRPSHIFLGRKLAKSGQKLVATDSIVGRYLGHQAVLEDLTPMEGNS